MLPFGYQPDPLGSHGLANQPGSSVRLTDRTAAGLMILICNYDVTDSPFL